ncbi:hypothetical protein FBU30_010297 [Linnemannia zychae]|nr:hypothetical protein FBU30_010297 [Linnemannia zychae]
MPSSSQQGTASKTSMRGPGHQFSRSDAELASILARPRGEQTPVTNDGVRVFVDLSKHTIVNFVDLVAQQHAQRARARKKEAKLAKKQQHAKRTVEAESSDAMEVDAPEETGPESAAHSEVDGEDVGESVGESDNSDNSDNSEDSEEDDARNPPPKKDFLDNLMDRFEKLYYVLDEDDEEERRAHEEGRPQKKRSRWDFESYDMNDDFIDDSEAMVQSMGIKLKPKESGFYVCRGPLEMVPVDEPTPRKRGGAGGAGGGRRKAPVSTVATSKNSNLAIVESAIEWASEVSEAERKPNGKSNGDSATTKKKRTTKAKIVAAEDADNDTNNDSDKQTKAPPSKRAKAKSNKNQATESTTAAPTTESSVPEDVTATSTPNNDSGTIKSSAATPSKISATSKTKSNSTSKATVSSSTTSAGIIPTVTVDSPPPTPMEGVEDSSTPQIPPSRPTSPLKTKPKRRSKKTAVTKQDGSLSADPTTDDAMTEDDNTHDARTMDISLDDTTADTASKTVQLASAGDQDITSRPPSPSPQIRSSSQDPEGDGELDSDDHIVELGPKPSEPLPEELQEPFKIVEQLVESEPWTAATSFPAPLRTALFAFGHQTLEYCKGSGKIIPDLYFDYLRSIIPYRSFTLRKLIYRVLLPNWIKDLEFEKTKLISQFKERTNKIWLASGLANQPSNQDADGDGNASGDEGKLQRKFPWTHDLRLLLWETMEMFMEIRQARHELHLVKDSIPAPPTDSKTRKDAYQTLLVAFPQGWTTSYEISRQYSQLKEKVQKQKMDKKEAELHKSASGTKPKSVSKSASASITGAGTSTGKLTKSTSSSKLTSSATTSSDPKAVGASSITTSSPKPTPAKPISASTSTTSPIIPGNVAATITTSTTSPLLTAASHNLTEGPRNSPPLTTRHVTPTAATVSSSQSPSLGHRNTATPEPLHPLPHQISIPPISQQSQIQQQQQKSQTQQQQKLQIQQQQPPQQQQQPPRTHFSYTSGPLSNSSPTSSLTKKRKTSEGVAQGSGSSTDPLIIGEASSQELDRSYERRRSPQPYYRDAGYPNQMSYTSHDNVNANVKSKTSANANKKAKSSAVDYGDYGGPSVGAPAPRHDMDSAPTYTGYHRTVGLGRGDRVSNTGISRDVSGHLSQQSSTTRRSYSPPLPPQVQQQRRPPVYRSRQPETIIQYRENPDMVQYHHHRPQLHELPGTGGGMYPPMMQSSPVPSSAPGVVSTRPPGGSARRLPPHPQRPPDDSMRHPAPQRAQQQPPTHYSRRS